MKGNFYTGGLAKMMTDFMWEVWVCQVEHPCSVNKKETLCFT